MPNKAPNFKIPSTNSKLLELKKIKSKYKVLYFYPKDNTPGCTAETKDFNSLLSQFKKLECEVIGISKDSMESHEKFRDKFKFRRGRLNCSLNDEGKWRWFGIQFIIKED